MIGSTEWKFAGLQVAVAAAVAFGAWVLQRNITPLTEGQSVFEILFDPTFWSGFFVFAATYVAIAAAIGWIVGVGVALAALAGVEAARRRSVIVLVAVPAICSALVMVGALLAA